MSISTESKTEFERLRDEIKRGTRVVSLGGLTSVAAKAFVLSKLQAETQKTFVVVTESNKDSEAWECDLEFWNGKRKTENEKSDETINSQLSTLNSQLFLPLSSVAKIFGFISPIIFSIIDL